MRGPYHVETTTRILCSFAVRGPSHIIPNATKTRGLGSIYHGAQNSGFLPLPKAVL